MERKKNVTHIGHLDFPGGGQITVRQGRAYVGHLKPPNDVAMDERGLFCLIDRHNGFEVLEFNG